MKNFLWKENSDLLPIRPMQEKDDRGGVVLVMSVEKETVIHTYGVVQLLVMCLLSILHLIMA